MPSQKNIDQLATLKDKLKNAKSVVFSDYHDLTVAQIQNLKAKIKESKGEFTIAKNTLLRLALLGGNRMGSSEVKTLKQILKGPTSILLATEDEIGPLKALVEFAKENEKPRVKAGIMDDRILTAEEVEELAKLPSRTILQTKLVGTLSAPLSGVVNVLQGNLQGLVNIIQAVKKQKEGVN